MGGGQAHIADDQGPTAEQALEPRYPETLGRGPDFTLAPYHHFVCDSPGGPKAAEPLMLPFSRPPRQKNWKEDVLSSAVYFV